MLLAILYIITLISVDTHDADFLGGMLFGVFFELVAELILLGKIFGG